MRFSALAFTLLLPFQVSPVGAQGMSPALAFEETDLELAREGHVSLTWNPIPDAVTYEVGDDSGRIQYRGVMPEAFISGLTDGQHRFTVRAYDATNRQLAISQIPAVVTVQHWPLAQALGLFAVGAIVFLAIVTVIVRGACFPADDRESATETMR
jgi:hypothetical protein